MGREIARKGREPKQSKNLVVLELPHSKLRTMWEPNMVSPIFEKLKTLNISLEALPKELGNAESLNLGRVVSLRELFAGAVALFEKILIKTFFEGYSAYGRQIDFYIGQAEFPEWISPLRNSESTVSIYLSSHNFSAMIFCLKRWGDNLDYNVKSSTSGLLWRGSFGTCDDQSLMVLVPKSIFSLKDGENKIIVSATAIIHGYHVLKETEITMTDEYGSSTVNDDAELVDSEYQEEVQVMKVEGDPERITSWSCIEVLCRWMSLDWLWWIRKR
ncbi:hypothetical protein POM88_020098 [Heracleum sosnowskyi]|uniref:Uncharacterized protein n=1 Tax=Heracleum sosnowskyi TaxID=360622 RepID=A0AAD8IDG7_9APIA|nr:hypothetical protein POM88_020098 [Heracleum sosnowskyi]